MAKYSDLYSDIDFKDMQTVKNLLYARALFEEIGYTSSEPFYSQKNPYENVYHDVMNIYMELDQLIARCKFTNKNIVLLQLIKQGYTISDIYNNLENYQKESTRKMFRRILITITDKQKEIEGGEKSGRSKNDEYNFARWDGEKVRQ